METMLSDNPHDALVRLGNRLRTERLARNEPQIRFSARLGVSVPTLRRMEQGDPTAQIGYWLSALELLDRLTEFEDLLASRPNLFISAHKTRQRARQKS